MNRNAHFSPCGTFRYILTRRWAEDSAALVFVMLNPSTANAQVDDPTIRRCIGFAKSAGFGGIAVVNLFAFRATKPADLKAGCLAERIGPENDAWIGSAVRGAVATGGEVVCAWGAHARGLNRAQDVLADIRIAGARPMCLDATADGIPRHPLMLPASCRVRPL